MPHFTKINLKKVFPRSTPLSTGNQILLIKLPPLRSTQLEKLSVKFCLFSTEATGIFWVVELRKWSQKRAQKPSAFTFCRANGRTLLLVDPLPVPASHSIPAIPKAR
jgi:hypothetical protein